jgi:hypothetical protein
VRRVDTPHASVPLVELELSRLDRRFSSLRICEPREVKRLALALEAQGQVSPVLVIESDCKPARYILLDGFLRVAALQRLRLDTVRALVLPLVEVEALAWCYRQQQGRRATALEEGWLVHELHVHLRQPLAAVAAGLERSTSWVSRRLGLVRSLLIENNFYKGRRFDDVADLNRQLRDWCDRVNRKYKRTLRAAPRDLFAVERPALRRLPLHIHQPTEVHHRTVDSQSYVTLHSNHYSVPAALLDRS